MTHSALARPTRRTLVRGAAWSVPVVSLAAMAPAFAASCMTVVNTMDLTTKLGSDGTPLQVTSVLVGGVIAGANNLSTNNFPTSGWLELENNPLQTTETNPTKYQDVTFKFGGQSVTELQFTISDIDSFGGGGNHTFWDRVAIVTPAVSPFTATPVDAVNTAVSGAGTLADPMRQTVYTNASSVSSNAVDHQMRVAFTGSITEVTVRFWSSRDNNKVGTQAIWIGNMVYKKNCT